MMRDCFGVFDIGVSGADNGDFAAGLVLSESGG